MNNSLRGKLVLSYLAISLLTALCIFFLIRLTSGQLMEQLVLEQELHELQTEVATWYMAEGDWDGFNQYFLALHPPPRRSSTGNNNSDNNEPRRNQPTSRGNHGIVRADRVLLNAYLNFNVGEILPEALLFRAMPVIVDEETIAWIVPDDATGISLQAEEQVFFERTNRVLLIASIVAVGASLFVGFGLANFITSPIRALTLASERMAQGNLKQMVLIDSTDEIGRLADSFNSMSQEVAQADEQRRQLTADIAHDLGTPLHIALGYLEIIQSSSQPATQEQLSIIESELNHLKNLIKDLDVLSQADTKSLNLDINSIALRDSLPHVLASFTPLAQERAINLHMRPLSDTLLPIMVDEERLVQVLGNILSNAIRFTPSEGEIELSVEQTATQTCIRVRDSGVGIPPDSLPYVFDRFYQADKSRGRSGKMGLGLAISKELVETMGGSISVDSQIGQGTTMSIYLTSAPM